LFTSLICVVIYGMNLVIEIRAAEGGDDAKQLVVEQSKLYSRLCSKAGL